MTAKQKFFDQVLGGLKQRNAYFSRDTIQAPRRISGAGIVCNAPSGNLFCAMLDLVREECYDVVEGALVEFSAKS